MADDKNQKEVKKSTISSTGFSDLSDVVISNRWAEIKDQMHLYFNKSIL